MTNFAAATPLLTDADMLVRVEQLVGPAAADRRPWIMWVDGDGRQAPVVVPVDDIPRHPDPSQLDGLTQVLSGLCDDLTTESGPCSVIFTLERLGLDGVLPGDRTWAAALAAVCERAGTPLRGTFLATRSGVGDGSDVPSRPEAPNRAGGPAPPHHRTSPCRDYTRIYPERSCAVSRCVVRRARR